MKKLLNLEMKKLLNSIFKKVFAVRKKAKNQHNTKQISLH
jgi:hypothetical protein